MAPTIRFVWNGPEGRTIYSSAAHCWLDRSIGRPGAYFSEPIRTEHPLAFELGRSRGPIAGIWPSKPGWRSRPTRFADRRHRDWSRAGRLRLVRFPTIGPRE